MKDIVIFAFLLVLIFGIVVISLTCAIKQDNLDRQICYDICKKTYHSRPYKVQHKELDNYVVCLCFDDPHEIKIDHDTFYSKDRRIYSK